MKFSATMRRLEFNLPAYQKKVEARMREQLASAATDWLRTVSSAIPVWSGASQGTLLQLASAARFSLSISPSSTAPDRIGLGLNNSEGRLNTEEFAQGRFTFTYSTTLPHLIYNEFNNANLSPDPTLISGLIHPGPYQFQLKGQLEFEKSSGSVSLPNPFDSLFKRTIRVR